MEEFYLQETISYEDNQDIPNRQIYSQKKNLWDFIGQELCKE